MSAEASLEAAVLRSLSTCADRARNDAEECFDCVARSRHRPCAGTGDWRRTCAPKFRAADTSSAGKRRRLAVPPSVATAGATRPDAPLALPVKSARLTVVGLSERSASP